MPYRKACAQHCQMHMQAAAMHLQLCMPFAQAFRHACHCHQACSVRWTTSSFLMAVAIPVILEVSLSNAMPTNLAWAACRFGRLLHDWPDSYFQGQQSKGGALADIFKQTMGQHQAHTAAKARLLLAQMFPGSALYQPGTKVPCCSRLHHVSTLY